MSIFWALLRRELSAFFFSLTGYLIIAVVTLLTGYNFVVLVQKLGTDPATMPLTEMFFSSYFFWLILLLVPPVITMRLFALEKASGTFETLMTTPVSDVQVVAAKFVAALIFYLVAWLPLLACLFLMQHFARQSSTLDAGTVGGMYLGIFLTGGLFLSLGCFASSLTRSQMASAIISFAGGVGLFSLAYLAKGVPVNDPERPQVLAYFNLFDQVDDFTRGVVDSRAVIFYATAAFLFLFLTLRVVESRRWK
ncbi:MAG: ABC transporter permease [Verrucomicrobiota bacterium]